MSKEKEARARREEDEDLPSDFFDDFSKAEFMAGLDVVDSWDVERKEEPDLRALLRTRKEEAAAAHRGKRDRARHTPPRRSPPRRTPPRRSPPRRSRTRTPPRRSPPRRSRTRTPPRRTPPHRARRSPERRRNRSPDIDRYIKTGSRRDVDKTNRDIKKDKELKVKEYLAKRLDSAEGDINPPGTELEGYFDGAKKRARKLSSSPVRIPRDSRRNNTRTSPCSPPSRRRRSPSRRRSNSRPRRSRSRGRSDNFLYPEPHGDSFHTEVFRPHDNYTPPFHSGFPPIGPYPFQPDGYYPPPGGPGPTPFQGPCYNNFNYGPGVPMNVQQAHYNYDPVPPAMVPAPQQMVHAPQQMVPTPQQMVSPSQQMVHTPQPVPAPEPNLPSQNIELPPALENTRDALDQLLAEGKISKEDYLKLTPKCRPITTMNMKEKVNLLARCHDAVTKLGRLHLPNRLIMGNLFLGPEQKAITSKFCSPLKRQPVVKFQFTTPKNAAVLNQNKQLVDSIIATIGLQQIVAKAPKKQRSQYKDACVQTTTPFCETCEIRLATKCDTTGTMVDLDHFKSSVHTQVIEVELASSKTMFTPSGNASESMSASMSLSHLTPAQIIVSQLAARAKKLENVTTEADADAFMRRRNAGMMNQGNNGPYHYSQNQGSNQYQNNYRF